MSASKLNVLILMAGSSKSFKEAGHIYPKMLLEIDGKSLVEHVIASYGSLVSEKVNFTFVIRKEDNQAYHLGTVIKLLMPDATILEVGGTTAGAACTALLAIDTINTNDALLILNGDQILHTDLGAIIKKFHTQQWDGGIVTFRAVHPKWSYVKTNADGFVIEAAEKRPISNTATAGAYYFKKGADFVEAVTSMIVKDAHVDGAFYVCPCYNEMVLRQKVIGTHTIEAKQYLSIITPQALQSLEEAVNTGKVRLYEAA
jgi:dTDP-glucose pyrophosphorylase